MNKRKEEDRDSEERTLLLCFRRYDGVAWLGWGSDVWPDLWHARMGPLSGGWVRRVTPPGGEEWRLGAREPRLGKRVNQCS
jgi:hypothetical protein